MLYIVKPIKSQYWDLALKRKEFFHICKAYIVMKPAELHMNAPRPFFVYKRMLLPTIA